MYKYGRLQPRASSGKGHSTVGQGEARIKPSGKQAKLVNGAKPEVLLAEGEREDATLAVVERILIPLRGTRGSCSARQDFVTDLAERERERNVSETFIRDRRQRDRKPSPFERMCAREFLRI